MDQKPCCVSWCCALVNPRSHKGACAVHMWSPAYKASPSKDACPLAPKRVKV